MTYGGNRKAVFIQKLIRIRKIQKKNEQHSKKKVNNTQKNHIFNGIILYLGNGDSKSVIEKGIISITGSSVMIKRIKISCQKTSQIRGFFMILRKEK